MKRLYDDDEFWEDVSRDSEARLAEPLPFALDAVEELFRYESDKEQGFVRWQRKMEQGIWWADDAIQCLEKVLTDPPEDLGDQIRSRGVNVWVQGDDGRHLGDAPAHVAWLRATAHRMREMFEHYVATKSAETAAQRDRDP